MTRNMDVFDRSIRVFLAFIFAILIISNFIRGLFAVVLGFVAFIFFLTSLVGFCPAYYLFKNQQKSL